MVNVAQMLEERELDQRKMKELSDHNVSLMRQMTTRMKEDLRRRTISVSI